MKKCPYCGTEYSDEATVCAIDTETLLEHPPKPEVKDESTPASKPVSEPAPVPRVPQKEAYVAWPDYQWSSRDAWKCIGILVCLELARFTVNYLVYLALPVFYHSPLGFLCRRIFLFGTWVLAACYFARTDSIKAFLRAVGLDQRPTDLAWFGITMALTIRFVTHFMHSHQWGPGVDNYEWTSFRNSIGPEKWLFQISPLIFAPIFEEAVNRGFLYKAFRRSYSLPISIILMVGWTCYTHWPYYYESWIAALNLSAWTVLQCYLREKSPSLWDCVLSHFVSNAVILLY